MLLAELRAKLEDTEDPQVKYLHFDCPHCRQPLITIKIAKTPAPGAQHVWRWNGQPIDKLTVEPSINVAGHWHGNVHNGETTA